LNCIEGAVQDEQNQAIGSRNTGAILLVCQGEVIELAKLLATDESTLRPFFETLAEGVESDAALLTKIVGIGNAAYFARAGGPTSSVEEALMRMGTRRAFDIVLMTGLRAQLMPEGPLHA
jgi:HD-like signal output (HDOD) protein